MRLNDRGLLVSGEFENRTLAEIIHGVLIEETDCRELTRSVSEGEP